MNQKSLGFFLAAALLLFAVSCKRTTDDKYKDDISKGYYPLKYGKYVTYDVDSTIWNDFDCTKTEHHYQMRYTLMDSFVDNQKRPSYRIETTIRSGDTGTWRNGMVIYVTPTSAGLEYVESNLRFMKMVFPVTDGQTWKGNSMILTNDQDLQYYSDWTYKYENLGLTSDGFENTVTVMQIDETQNDPEAQPGAYAYKTYARDVYAYDVGLVVSEKTHWIYDPGVKPCRKGYSVVMHAVDHN